MFTYINFVYIKIHEKSYRFQIIHIIKFKNSMMLRKSVINFVSRAIVNHILEILTSRSISKVILKT